MTRIFGLPRIQTRKTFSLKIRANPFHPCQSVFFSVR